MVYITSNSVYSGMYTSLRGLVGQYGNGYTLLYLTKTPTQVSCTFIVWTSDMPELRSTVNSAKQTQHSFLIVNMQLSHKLSSSPLLASFPCRLSSQKKVTLFLKCQESLGTGLSHSPQHTSLRMQKDSAQMLYQLLVRQVSSGQTCSYQIMSECEPNFIPSTFHHL